MSENNELINCENMAHISINELINIVRIIQGFGVVTNTSFIFGKCVWITTV